jgi:hypothetical protein
MNSKDFLSNNMQYFNENFDIKSDEIILFESFYPIKNLIYGITKVGLTLSSILNLKPICILPPSNKNHDFIKSLCKNTINSRSLLLKSIFGNFTFLITIFFRIDKMKLLNLTIDGINIGKYIYDAILIRNKIISIDKINFKFRLNIILDLAFYFCFKQLFLKYNVKYLVLGDNTYRHGLLFELSKKFNVKCIAPVNLNSFKLSKFICKDDYYEHCYSITNKYLKEIKNKNEAIRIANDYFVKRFSGSIEQHDILNAFDNKKIKTKEQFCIDYNLDQRKKIVAIIPHIFCDAPHAYPNTLYSDYYEWFVETVKILSKNLNINIIVKEHPSAHLYNEEGKLDEILKKYNFNITRINPNENQYSLIQTVDIVVTCGGTIGLEFSCTGKPVILAAKPPYSNLGFTIDNKNIDQYKENLLNCHLLENLSRVKKENALLTAYLSYCINEIDITKLEIGSEIISLGKKYSDNLLYENILDYQKIKISDQYIFSYLKDFLNNNNRLGINFK